MNEKRCKRKRNTKKRLRLGRTERHLEKTRKRSQKFEIKKGRIQGRRTRDEKSTVWMKRDEIGRTRSRQKIRHKRTPLTEDENGETMPDEKGRNN